MITKDIYRPGRRRIINYCSAPPGSGKTHQSANRSRTLAEDFNKVLIAQPTRELTEKTADDEIHPFPFKIFHKGTVEGSVAKALADYVAEVPDEIQEILLATHQVLPHIKNFPNKDKWHLIIDEESQVVRYDKHEIPKTHDLITDYLAVRSVNSIYGRVDVIDRAAVLEIAKNEEDDEIRETLAGTCRILLNPYWESYVNIEQYQALLSGEGGILAFHSILKPDVLDGFASVFMTSAKFEDSQVFKVWGQLGVEFKPDPEFSKSLRYSTHTNGEAVTIYYAIDNQWSRRRKEAILDDGQTTLDRMIKAANELFTSGRFLWHANKRVIESPFQPGAKRLPNKPHGLNTFADYDDIVFLSSLNPTTDHFRFLRSRGIEGDEVRGFTYFSGAYQAIMRTSIRDPQSRSRKRVLVPDLSLAEYLHDILPGSTLEKIDIGLVEQPPRKPGRPKKHATNRERVAAQRQQAREKRFQLLADLFQLRVQDTDEGNCEKDRAENSIKLYSDLGTQPLTATIYSAKNSPMPWAYASGEIPAFVRALRLAHKETPKSKEEMGLFSPAIFDPSRPTGKRRGKGNILYLRHVVLDFEDGELEPETLPRLFPDLQMVITNTYRHTCGKPRFRAVIFTDQRMTVEAYTLVYGWIADKLEEAGYGVNRASRRRKTSGASNLCPSGLDWKKSAPTSLFWLPSQAGQSQDSFFDEYLEGRHALSPSIWIENSVIPLQPIFDIVETDTQRRDVNRELVQSAIQTWRTSRSHKGLGNAMFFDLAVSLKCAGMAFLEIESTLRSEVRHAETQNERLAQIPSIMASLSNYSASWRQRTQAVAAVAAA
jgi:hypothetical protein